MSVPKTLTELFGLNTAKELEAASQIVRGSNADLFIRKAILEPYADGVIKNSVLYTEYDRIIGTDAESVKLIRVDKQSVSFQGKPIPNLIIPKPEKKFQSAIIQSRSGRAQPRTRNVNELNVFLNSLPSYVPSMMVPYLDVEFDVKRSNVSALQRTAPTLTRFLMGNDFKGKDATLNDLSTNVNREEGTSRTFIGMEVFTSPQTLVNPDINATGGLKNPILDPFRPFMSLESAEISVQPEVGFFTKKRAKIALKLHDRSRLSEISDMIRPQTYTGTNVWLTYGWIYPKTPGPSDPYEEFINSTMLVKECYGIVNCSYSFDQFGQATINLELFTRSITELRNLNTDKLLNLSNLEFTQKAKDVSRELDKLLDESSGISSDAKEKLRAFMRGTDTKELRVFQVLHAAERDEVPDVTDAKATDLIANLTNVLKTDKKTNDAALTKSLKGLEGALTKYLATFKDKAKLKNSISSAANQGIKEYFSELNKIVGSKTGDYFIANIPKDHQIQSKLKKVLTGAQKNQIISFGTLVSNVILSSIAKIAQTETVECQIIFYNFNSSCSNLSNLNIAEFPIQFEEFKKQLNEELVNTKVQAMSIEQLIKFIVTHQIEDPRHIMSDLREYYTSISSDPLIAKVKEDKQNVYATQLKSATENRGIYKTPVIECYVEALPLSEAGGLRTDNAAGTINLLSEINKKPTRLNSNYGTMFRFHIFDKQLSAYPEVEEYEARTVSTSTGTATAIQVQGSTVSPKDIITKNIPTVVFGANGTSVMSATIASQHEPLLSSVQMLKPVMKPTNIQPNGSDAGGLPLRIIPSTLNTTMLGCPLLYPAQSLYFDFQTGTTLDNVYILTHLTHHIGPGKFQTVCQFTPHDAYGQYESLVSTLNTTLQKIKLLNTTR